MPYWCCWKTTRNGAACSRLFLRFDRRGFTRSPAWAATWESRSRAAWRARMTGLELEELLPAPGSEEERRLAAAAERTRAEDERPRQLCASRAGERRRPLTPHKESLR